MTSTPRANRATDAFSPARVGAAALSFGLLIAFGQTHAQAPASKPKIRVGSTAAPGAAAVAATPAKPKEKLLTRAELRECFVEQVKNDADAAALVKEQTQYKIDYEVIKKDQAALNAEIDASKAAQADLGVQRAALNTDSSALQSKSLAVAKPTDADKATWEAERTALVARAKLFDDKIVAFNASQQGMRERAAALDARIGPINALNKAQNTRVETLDAVLKDWREQCGNKPFDERDELAVKKELGLK